MTYRCRQRAPAREPRSERLVVTAQAPLAAWPTSSRPSVPGAIQTRSRSGPRPCPGQLSDRERVWIAPGPRACWTSARRASGAWAVTTRRSTGSRAGARCPASGTSSSIRAPRARSLERRARERSRLRRKSLDEEGNVFLRSCRAGTVRAARRGGEQNPRGRGLVDELPEILVRGCDAARRRADGLAAHGAHSPDWRTRRSLPWTLAGDRPPRREERPALASTKSRARLAAPVKAPRAWPKSSLSSSARAGGAVERDERAIARGPSAWIASRDELLARAGLARDERRGGGARDALDERAECLHGRARAEDLPRRQLARVRRSSAFSRASARSRQARSMSARSARSSKGFVSSGGAAGMASTALSTPPNAVMSSTGPRGRRA